MTKPRTVEELREWMRKGMPSDDHSGLIEAQRLMVVSVSGGQLTDESMKRIQEYLDEQIHGTTTHNKILVLEAGPDADGPPMIGIDWATPEGADDAVGIVAAEMEHHKMKILETFRVPADKLFPPDHPMCRCETAETSVEAAKKTPKKP